MIRVKEAFRMGSITIEPDIRSFSYVLPCQISNLVSGRISDNFDIQYKLVNELVDDFIVTAFVLPFYYKEDKRRLCTARRFLSG